MLAKILLSGALVWSTTAFGATLVHDYNLTSSLNDLVGSDNLNSDGGTISGAGYTFGANQGVNLTNALTSGSDYSLVLDFSFSSLSGYRKIVDFNDKSEDSGLYNLDTELDYYPVAASGTGVFAADTPARVVLTRDGTTGDVAGYVDGVQELSFTDTGGIATASTADELLRFFEDDNVTSLREASSGVATRISIYDGALTAAQVQALGGPSLPNGGTSTPEPGTLLLMSAGLACLIYKRR